MSTTQKCVCGEPAPQRCSRCHNKYYCSALCSAQNWSAHKSFCYPLPLGLIQEPANSMLREGLKLGTFAFYQNYHVMVQESLKEGNHLGPYYYAQYFLYHGAIMMLLLNPSAYSKLPRLRSFQGLRGRRDLAETIRSPCNSPSPGCRG
ncbi:MAG: zinc finger MYND domain-containing protein [archaeon]|nr:zinc finger MYND domain-containing protein [archaeon]